MKRIGNAKQALAILAALSSTNPLLAGALFEQRKERTPEPAPEPAPKPTQTGYILLERAAAKRERKARKRLRNGL